MDLDCRIREINTHHPRPTGRAFVRGCPKDCGCDHYCVLRSETKFHLEHDDKIQALAHESGCGAHPPKKEVTLQFCGLQLTLDIDGEWSLDDTTGG